MGVRFEYDQLLDRVRHFVEANRISGRQLAKMAGVSEAAVRGIRTMQWAPSAPVLTAVLDAMDAFGDVPPARVDADRFTQGIALSFKSNGRCVERVFTRDAVEKIVPEKLRAVHAYVQHNRVSAPRVVQSVTGLVPGGAVHLTNAVGDDAAAFRFTHWDSSTGFDGGRDYKGKSLRAAPDSAYRENVYAAYMAVRETALERMSFVGRRGPDGLRLFYRLLEPLVGPDGAPQILCVTLPEKPGAARQFLPDRYRL